MKKIVYLVSLFVMAGIILVACKKDDDSTPPAEESNHTVTTFSPTSGPIGTLVKVNGTEFTNQNIIVMFNGVNAEISSVHVSGEFLHALVPSGAETGKISVTIDGEEVRSSTDFVVTSEPTSITLDQTELQLFDDDTSGSLSINELDLFDGPIVAWSSNTEEVLTVDENGNLSPVSPGEATITAKVNSELTATCEILVLPGFYAVGDKDSGNNSDNTALFWDNQATNELANNGARSMSHGIIKTGDDVLAIGQDQINNLDSPIIWNNGNAETLTKVNMDSHEYATAITFNEGNQIIAGMTVENGILTAVVWGNGHPTVIGDGLTDEEVYSITTRGEDIVVGGIKYDDNSESSVATIWVGTNENGLSNGTSAVNSVLGNGEDILAVGYDGSDAVVWRNDDPEILSYESPAIAEEIFIDNNIEYIVGSSSDGKALLWIDEEVTELSENNAKAFSINIKNGNILIGGEENGIATVWWVNEDGVTRTIPLGDPNTESVVNSLIAK